MRRIHHHQPPPPHHAHSTQTWTTTTTLDRSPQWNDILAISLSHAGDPGVAAMAMDDWNTLDTKPAKKRVRRWQSVDGGGAPPAVAEPRRHAAEPHRRSELTIASDCAGLHSVSLALTMLSLPHRTAFLSEIDERTLSVIKENFNLNGTSVCKDVMTRDDEKLNSELKQTMGVVDLYSAGPPCQSFSHAGKKKGIADSRGIVFLRLLQTVQAILPRCFIFENVPGLASKTHAHVLGAILHTLQGIRSNDGKRVYSVRWRILDTKIHGGLPQNRKRLYIVGWKREEAKHEFAWPAPIECKNVDELISIDGVSFVRGRLTHRRRQIIARCNEKIRAAGGDRGKTHIMDLNSGWEKAKKPPTRIGISGISPCLTRTRCREGGHWLVRQGRFMTLTEIEALQGFPQGGLRMPAGVTERELAAMFGNAFTINVIGRVALNLLRALGMVDETCVDAWADDRRAEGAHRLRR